MGRLVALPVLLLVLGCASAPPPVEVPAFTPAELHEMLAVASAIQDIRDHPEIYPAGRIGELVEGFLASRPDPLKAPVDPVTCGVFLSVGGEVFRDRDLGRAWRVKQAECRRASGDARAWWDIRGQ